MDVGDGPESLKPTLCNEWKEQPKGHLKRY